MGPVVVSVTALTISLMTYVDQHQANTAVENSSRQQQAELVSFLQQDLVAVHADKIILINNDSDAPIYNAGFTVVGETEGFSVAGQVYLGDIPACSSGHIAFSTIANLMNKESVRPASWNSTVNYDVQSMSFTDNDGATWVYTEGSPLERASGDSGFPITDEDNSYPLTIPSPQYEPAAGCS